MLLFALTLYFPSKGRFRGFYSIYFPIHIVNSSFDLIQIFAFHITKGLLFLSWFCSATFLGLEFSFLSILVLTYRLNLLFRSYLQTCFYVNILENDMIWSPPTSVIFSMWSSLLYSTISLFCLILLLCLQYMLSLRRQTWLLFNDNIFIFLNLFF